MRVCLLMHVSTHVHLCPAPFWVFASYALRNALRSPGKVLPRAVHLDKRRQKKGRGKKTGRILLHLQYS